MFFTGLRPPSVTDYFDAALRFAWNPQGGADSFVYPQKNRFVLPRVGVLSVVGGRGLSWCCFVSALLVLVAADGENEGLENLKSNVLLQWFTVASKTTTTIPGKSLSAVSGPRLCSLIWPHLYFAPKWLLFLSSPLSRWLR